MFDRLEHWLMAACVLTLMLTAFLPILGIEFAWVNIHWITGLVLIAAVLVHIVRSLFWKRLAAMWIGIDDFGDVIGTARWSLRQSDCEPAKPGKYSVAQKLIHLCFAVTVLTATITGGLMLAKIDTPWWERNPYFLGEPTWGLVYVFHGLAALLLITMVISHVYFALRPEKLLFTRAMILGWITRQEFESHHDPERWQVEEQ